MKYILLFFALFPLVLEAQVKFDNIWMLGKPNSYTAPTVSRGIKLDFYQSPPKVDTLSIPFDFDAIAGICDSAGNLLFYTNGCEIANRNHTIMKNGREINEGGLVYEYNCTDYLSEPHGYPTAQGCLILPWPGHPKRYLLLHLHKPDSMDLWYIHNLKYTLVDMSGDDGLGEVAVKNHQIYQDTFLDMLTSVRHANGRDWWIVLPKYNMGRYYTFLLSPQGFSEPIVQDIGKPINHATWGIQAMFSPNGRRYANISPEAGLQIFDFDRCSGRLSNPLTVNFRNGYAFGVAFSQNSRFLYAGTGASLYQFDMRVEDIFSSQVQIGEYDGFGYLHSKDISPLPTNFYQMMLAPDGKIYMSTPNGTRFFHVIHQPDSLGLACDFEQRGLEFPVSHSFSPPNFPHFRLYDLPGSVCDTLGINGPQPPEDTLPPPPVCGTYLSLWPNPVSSVASVELPDCQGGLLSVFDASGRLVEEQRIAPREGAHPIVVSSYVPGIYFVRFWPDKGGEMLVRGLSVVR